MSSGVLWIALVAGSIVVVVGFGYFGRRQLINKREPEDIAVIHALISDQVSLDVFSDVLNAVGQAYSIDPRLIRPEDSLEKLLSIDSWSLDVGTEKLNRWLVSNGISEQPPSIRTILDLARLVEEGRKR